MSETTTNKPPKVRPLNRIQITSAVLVLAIVAGVTIQHHHTPPASAGWVKLLATTGCQPLTGSTPATVQSGSTGGCVKILQFLLQNGTGHAPGGPPTENGTFDANTKHYVVEFQRQSGLTANGIVDPKTWTKLEACIDDAAKTISGIWICQKLS